MGTEMFTSIHFTFLRQGARARLHEIRKTLEKTRNRETRLYILKYQMNNVEREIKG